MSLRTAVLVASVIVSGSAWAQQTPQPEEFTIASWKMRLMNYRPRNLTPPGADSATSATEDEAPYFGVTVWRLRGSVPNDERAIRRSIKEDGHVWEWTPERFPVAPVVNGQKLLIGIEVTRPGFLYVVRRATYSHGLTGPPRLVFPLPDSPRTANRSAPGQIIQVPPPGGKTSHYTIERTRTDQIGETFIVLFSQRPIPELLNRSVDLSEADLKNWAAKWGSPVNSLADSANVGTVLSTAEVDAANRARVLTQDDPPPMTIYHCYHCKTQSGNPVLFNINLEIRNPVSTFPQPSGPMYRVQPPTGNPQASAPRRDATPPATHSSSGITGGLTGRVTSGAFLTPVQSEQPGYGLYSYLLFGSRPESLISARWQRFEQAIAAFLDIPSATDVAQYVAAARMNISFLPVIISQRELPLQAQPRVFHFDRERLASHATEHQAVGKATPSGPDTACILVSNYDYARAQVLLSIFAEPHPEGPYIVSVVQPLSQIRTPPQQYLYQDLSAVPPELIRLWVQEFIAQSREQEFWKTRSKEQFILRIRTTIGIASNQVTDFTGAIKWSFATVAPSGGR